MESIALVDDHVLLRNGLANLLKDIGFTVLFEASNGKEFISLSEKQGLPDLVLMDINMPQMDGYETSLWLKNHHPEVKVLALSMYDDEDSIIRMLKNGARGYILKDSDPSELKAAITSVFTKGFYYSEMVTGRLINTINHSGDNRTFGAKDSLSLTKKEIEFLKLSCTEMTYKEIAEKMFVSPRTVDGYRDDLFEKLNIKSRVGLVLYAIRNGLVSM